MPDRFLPASGMGRRGGSLRHVVAGDAAGMWLAAVGNPARPGRIIALVIVSAAAVLAAQIAVAGFDADAALTAIGMLVVAAMAIAGSGARRDAELDRRDLAELAARLDPRAGVVAIATEIAESVAGWGMFGTVSVIGFEGRRSASVLAKCVTSMDAMPHEAGESLPMARVAYLRERAEHGPWIERARADLVVSGGRSRRSIATHALAYVPMAAPEGVAALIAVAALPAGNDAGLSMLTAELPVLVDAAALAANALVPALARQEAEVERRESLVRTIA